MNKYLKLTFFLSVIFLLSCNNSSTDNAGQASTQNTDTEKILAPTPPMGWNSWNCFGIEVTEDQVKAVADYMAEHLKEYGWEYVVVDAGWYHAADFPTPDWNDHPTPPQSMDEYGRLIPDTDKFPSAKNGAGFKPLADYVHNKGLKFGIHIMRGVPWNAAQEKTPIKGTNYTADEIAESNNRCEWTHVMHGIDMTHPGGMAYYESLVELYASWGVDYIKADDMSRPYRVDEIEAISKALEKSSRDIVLSLSPGSAPLMAAKHLREHAHLWRISNDFWDSWGSLKNMFDLCAQWAPYIVENHWPDADMLPLGKLRKNGVGVWEASLFNATSAEVTDEYSRLTQTEQTTLMNLWAIFRSPLMMGGYLPENDEFTLSLLTNKELIDVNQHSKNNKVLWQNNSESVWMADSPDGGKYLAVFNLSNSDRTIKVSLEKIGVEGNLSFVDIWSGEKKQVEGAIEETLLAHASVLFKIEKD